MILTDPTLSEVPKKIIVEQRCNGRVGAHPAALAWLVEQFDPDRGFVLCVNAKGDNRPGGRADSETD